MTRAYVCQGIDFEPTLLCWVQTDARLRGFLELEGIAEDAGEHVGIFGSFASEIEPWGHGQGGRHDG